MGTPTYFMQMLLGYELKIEGAKEYLLGNETL